MTVLEDKLMVEIRDLLESILHGMDPFKPSQLEMDAVSLLKKLKGK